MDQKWIELLMVIMPFVPIVVLAVHIISLERRVSRLEARQGNPHVAHHQPGLDMPRQ
jgi:hypothetical protein